MCPLAGKFFQEFEIPAEYENLWRYMHHMYLLDAFTQSCPADQDIINHYKLQQVSVTQRRLRLVRVRFPGCYRWQEISVIVAGHC